LSVAVVKGDYKEGENLTLIRKFDPQWLAPLRFLDLAQDLIERDISNASLGQIIICQGSVAFHDYRLLLEVLKDRAIRGRITNDANTDYIQTINNLGVTTEEYNKKNAADKQKLRKQAAELIWGVVTSLPLRPQMVLEGEHGRIWGVLREEGMIMSYDELAITHGPTIPGEWTVVGLLDARRDPPPEEAPAAVPTAEEAVPNAPAITSPEGQTTASGGVSGMIRKIVGRPADTYAVTPLMIYRTLPTK
jgi:hypothetical protein